MWHRLAFRLPALVVGAVLVAVTAGSVFALGPGRSEIRKQTIENTQRKLDGYLSGVEQYLLRARELLEFSSGHLGLGGPATVPGPDVGDPPQVVADALLATSSGFDYVMLIGGDGAVRFVRTAGSARPTAALGSVAGRPWFRGALDGRFTVSDLELSLATGRPTVVLAVPVRDSDGVVVAVWAGGLRLEELSRMGAVPGGRPAREAHGYVTDRTGLVVAHQANPDFVRQQTDFSSVVPVQRALAGEEYAGFHWNGVERREKVAAAAPLPSVGWAVVFASPAESALEPITDMTFRGILAALVAGLLLAATSWLLVRRALRPLRRLREAAASLGTGDLTARAVVGRHDEVGALAGEMNRMAENLQLLDRDLRGRALELEQTVETLAETVTQRDATVAELDGFSYSVSHDLRAPLRAISGFTEAALEDSPDLTPESRESLTRTVRATQRMSQLIDDLLRLSRVSRTELHQMRLDVTAIVQQVVGDLRQQEPERTVEVRLQPGMVVAADPELLTIALRNLVANAWKFTAQEPSAWIEVSSVDGPDGPEIIVRDNGAGFDPAYADRLFTPFQRLHRQVDFPGSGIGLAIVRRVAARHGGSVTATGSPGDGAEFRLRLPQPPPLDAGVSPPASEPERNPR